MWIVRNLIYSCLVWIASATLVVAATRVPLTFYHELPFITVKLNHETVPLLFDIGTPTGAMLSKELLAESEAKDTGLSVNLETFKSKFRVKVYELHEMTIGDKSFRKVSAVEYPGIAHFTDSKRQDFDKVLQNGTIGLNTLLGHRVLVDYPRAQLIILSENERLPADYSKYAWHAVPVLELGNHKIVTEATIAGHDTWVLWDTGNTGMLMAEQLARQIAPDIKVGQMLRVRDFYLKGVNYGPQSFRVIRGQIPDALISIGTPFFKQQPVLFQFDAKQPTVLIGVVQNVP